MNISKCCYESVETKVKGFFNSYELKICSNCGKIDCEVIDLDNFIEEKDELIEKQQKKIRHQRAQLRGLNKSFVNFKAHKILQLFKSFQVSFNRPEQSPGMNIPKSQSGMGSITDYVRLQKIEPVPMKEETIELTNQMIVDEEKTQ